MAMWLGGHSQKSFEKNILYAFRQKYKEQKIYNGQFIEFGNILQTYVNSDVGRLFYRSEYETSLAYMFCCSLGL